MDYAVSYSELWAAMADVSDKVLKKSPIDSEIKLEFLDIPAIHCYSEKVSSEFFKALADTR